MGMPVTPSIFRASLRCRSTTGDGSGTYTAAISMPSFARNMAPISKLPTCAVRRIAPLPSSRAARRGASPMRAETIFAGSTPEGPE